MNPEWQKSVASCNPRPHGPNDAVQAIIAWCLKMPGDIRMHCIIAADDSAVGGGVIGRALRGGGWNGTGLAQLAAELRSDKKSLLINGLLDGRQKKLKETT